MAVAVAPPAVHSYLHDGQVLVYVLSYGAAGRALVEDCKTGRTFRIAPRDFDLWSAVR